MYICYECECVFQEPERYCEKHGLSYGPYEYWDGCPHCGGAYTETYRCDACGEWITGEYVEINDEKYCDNCFTLYDVRD